MIDVTGVLNMETSRTRSLDPDGAMVQVQGETRSLDERRELIRKELERSGKVDVRHVADALGVSQMTVRRDLAHLDRMGVLRRVHGGATTRPSPALRSEFFPREKQGIALTVAELIGGVETVGLDVGSTCTAVANLLATRDDVTVVTNSLHAALQFQYSRSSLLVLGGLVNEEGSLVDGTSFDAASRIRLDKLVLGCGGISTQEGISYHDMRETALRTRLIQRADRVILAADHSKFNVVKPIILGDFGLIDVLVTDAVPPAELRDALAESNVEVVVA